MSTSAADEARLDAVAEPLTSLLDKIEQARTLPELEAYRPAAGDPLARLDQTMRGEASPGQDGPGASAAAPTGVSDQPQPSTAHAVVGREVLEILQSTPLPGPARARAVERLASQLDTPDPHALRELLRILVTGQPT